MEVRLKEIYKDEWEWRKQDFDVLCEVAVGTSGIMEFVSEYVLDPKLETTVKQGEAGEKDNVILTTIHSSKGLESSICYLLKASPASYPTTRAVENGVEAIEEERRCLYVALTRAKDELHIYRNIHSHHVDTQNRGQSDVLYFFNNMPNELYESETTPKVGRIETSEYKGEAIGTDILGEFDFS